METEKPLRESPVSYDGRNGELGCCSELWARNAGERVEEYAVYGFEEAVQD